LTILDLVWGSWRVRAAANNSCSPMNRSRREADIALLGAPCHTIASWNRFSVTATSIIICRNVQSLILDVNTRNPRSSAMRLQTLQGFIRVTKMSGATIPDVEITGHIA
jgi:hypothetical protein